MPAVCWIGNGLGLTLGGVFTGGPSHGSAGLAVLWGAGATATKSALLSSVSAQRAAAVRWPAVVLDRAGAGAVSKKLAVP